jgi:hypothetical protein
MYFIPAHTSRGLAGTYDVKNALTNYGAVYTSFYWNESFFYKTATRAYYQPPAAADPQGDYSGGHAVTIIGWNDNYAKTNFKTAPAGNGAWLVKNSWGTGWGNAGYFWVSYYDKWFTSAIVSDSARETAVFRSEGPTNYNRIYSYDRRGWVDNFDITSVPLTAKTGSMANRYTAVAAGTIKAVGFYTTEKNATVTVKIYKNPTSILNPESGTLVSTKGPVKLPYMGYNTVVLTTQPSVVRGDVFVAVVTVTNPTYAYWVAEERNAAGYSSGVVAYPYEGYLKSGSTWYDLWDITTYYANLPIKVYTS